MSKIKLSPEQEAFAREIGATHYGTFDRIFFKAKRGEPSACASIHCVEWEESDQLVPEKNIVITNQLQTIIINESSFQYNGETIDDVQGVYGAFVDLLSSKQEPDWKSVAQEAIAALVSVKYSGRGTSGRIILESEIEHIIDLALGRAKEVGI